MELARKHFPTTQEMTGWVYDALKGRDYGETIPYDELSRVCTVDVERERRARAAVLGAGKKLLEREQKCLVNVKTVGFRIVQPSEQREVGRRKHLAGARRIREGYKAVTFVNVNLIADKKDLDLLIKEQTRLAMAVMADTKIRRLKKLPTREQVRMPTGKELLKALSEPAKG